MTPKSPLAEVGLKLIDGSAYPVFLSLYLHGIACLGGCAMSQFRIEFFDACAANPEVWAAFHAYRRAIARELRPDDPDLDDRQCECEMRQDDPLWEVRRWAAFKGQEIVGAAHVWYRKAETPNAGDHAPYLSCFGAVLSGERRKGVGSALMREILHLAHSLGKMVLTFSAHLEAGHAFLQHLGAEAKLSSIESRAILADLDYAKLQAWENGVEGLGLQWECYAGRTPRPVLISLLPAFTALIRDVPLGSLEHPPFRFEIEGYDEFYGRLDRSGGAHHLVLLRERDGGVAGMSEAHWDGRTPGMVFQALTAVARPWRRQGLARALKAAMIRQVRSSHPEAAVIKTSNSETNEAMRAINQRVGFRRYRRYSEYQVTRAELDKKVSAA